MSFYLLDWGHLEFGDGFACNQLVGARMDQAPHHFDEFVGQIEARGQIGFGAIRRDVSHFRLFTIIHHRNIKSFALFIGRDRGFHWRKLPVVFNAPFLHALFKDFFGIRIVSIASSMRIHPHSSSVVLKMGNTVGASGRFNPM